jgi:hypothetical protein
MCSIPLTASNDSSTSSGRIGATVALRFGLSSISPSAARSFSASRSGVRETPRVAQRLVSFRQALARLKNALNNHLAHAIDRLDMQCAARQRLDGA